MFKSMSRRATAGLMAIAVISAQIIMPVQEALATSKGTVSGNRTSGCGVNWYGKSIMDVDGAPDVPANLMVDMNGNPVDYSNGGYAYEVSPAIDGAPGRFEIQHWMTETSMNWRIFVGTNNNINNALVSLNLPAGYTYTVSDASAWGLRYNSAIGSPWINQHTFSDRSPADGILLGNMTANSETVIMITAAIPTTDYHNTFVGEATLTGNYNGYNQGNAQGEATNCVQVTQPTVDFSKIDCNTVSLAAWMDNNGFFEATYRIINEKKEIVKTDTFRQSLSQSSFDLPVGHTYTAEVGYLFNGTWYPKATSAAVNLTEACPITTPTPPAPSVGPCQLGLAGQTIRKQISGDVNVRTKIGTGGETNADSWASTYRLYGATDSALKNVTFTATAMEGMVFKPGTFGTVHTGDNNPATDSGALGQLDNNGYDGTASGIGIPQISADGKTITLTIANMPAKTPFAFNVDVIPDPSGATMVINETLIGDYQECTGSISGTVYWDRDMSKDITGVDGPYANKTVTLIDQTTGAVVATTTSDAFGGYTFENVMPGNYKVAIALAPGETNTTPLVIGDITVNRGDDVTDIDFGLFMPGRGSAGHTDTPTYNAVLPVVAKKTLPAELPHTGPRENIALLIIGGVMAALTYGAVYFAQGKRQYE